MPSLRDFIYVVLVLCCKRLLHTTDGYPNFRTHACFGKR